MNVFDRVLGISPQALAIRSQRIELLSANLANADTPDYKAMDINFGAAMASVRSPGLEQARTNAMHFDIGGAERQAQYRVPFQTSLDGNTVETQEEHAAFMDNAIRYQASLNFLDGRIKTMMLALRGD